MEKAKKIDIFCDVILKTRKKSNSYLSNNFHRPIDDLDDY